MQLPPARNFYELFAATAARFSARTAVEVQRRDRLDRFTFAELERLVAHAASRLAAAGIARNHRCAILADNSCAKVTLNREKLAALPTCVSWTFMKSSSPQCCLASDKLNSI